MGATSVAAVFMDRGVRTMASDRLAWWDNTHTHMEEWNKNEWTEVERGERARAGAEGKDRFLY